MHSKLVTAFVSLLCVTVILSQPAKAEPLAVDIFDLPPFTYKDNGKYVGIIHDITKLVIAESEIESKIRISPLSRMLERLRRGKSDWTIMLRSGWSADTFDTVELVHPNIRSVVIPKAGIKLRTYEDLKEISLATPRGMVLGHAFDKDTSLKRVQTTDYLQSATIFKAGRVDAMVGVEIGLMFNANAVGLSKGDLDTPYVLNTSEIWLHITSDRVSKEQKQKLKDTVENLRISGKIQEVFDRYIPGQ